MSFDPCLKIRALQIPVHIGVSESERAHIQSLRVEVSLQLSSIQQAARTDELQDTLDVDRVVNALVQMGANIGADCSKDCVSNGWWRC